MAVVSTRWECNVLLKEVNVEGHVRIGSTSEEETITAESRYGSSVEIMKL